MTGWNNSHFSRAGVVAERAFVACLCGPHADRRSGSRGPTQPSMTKSALGKMFSRLGQLDETKQIPANPSQLHFVATGEKLVPITTQRTTQTHERWQTWKVFACFDVLNVARTDTNPFGQFLLSQTPPRP
jgi:hypothetical protein